MEQRVLETAPLEEQDPCDWRQLALGMAALVANMPERHDDMLSQLAHHLRPSMAALRASAARLEAAAAEQSGAATARDLTACIVEQTDLMARWVGTMLEVQRIRLGKVRLDIRPVDIVDIARRCAADFRVVHVRVVSSGPTLVSADACRLTQVINTVWSALATVDSCHEITLRIGPGVWPTHKSESPLDLDLFVARELVRLHGGDLWTEDRAAIVVLPVQFPPRSHTILASHARCFQPR